MNFEVRCTDAFQPIDKNDLWGIVIKDAKFALPEIKPHLPGYVCLDELDYPLEHDDISIMFKDKAGEFVLYPVIWSVLLIKCWYMQREMSYLLVYLGMVVNHSRSGYLDADRSKLE